MKLFSVHDSKAQHFLNPMTFRTSAEALRAFETTSRDPKSQFNMYPSDYTLVELGTFNPDTGEIQVNAKPVILANASDYASHQPQA